AVRAGLGRRTAGAMAVMLVATNAPDLDIVTAMTGGAVPYLAAHRGWTHGPLGVAGLSLLAAVIVWLLLRRRADPVRRPALLDVIGVALVGGCLHVLMDLPTSYGTRILTPFDRGWFAFDWMPIIEIYVWVLLFAGIVVMRVQRTRRQTIARAVL